MPVTRRVLYVTPFALAPRIEGHRKRMAMTFDKLVAKGYQVDVLFISREYEWSSLFNRELYKELQAMGDTFHFVHAATPTDPKNKVFELDEWWPPQADDYCRWLFDNNGYDMIFCNYIFMSRVLDLCKRAATKVIDTHDLFADRDRYLIVNGLKPEFFYTDHDNEAAGLDRADVAIAIKDEEAEYFKRITDARVMTLPYVEADPYVETVALRPRGARRAFDGEPMRFGFFGSSNSINVRNIVDFIAYLESALPEEGYPFEFWLYGSLCKRLKGSMPSYVRLGGMVEGPAEFYESVDCVVNPQYFSTGLKIKIAEGLAFGTPLICHKHSFEGFGAPLDKAQNCASFDEVLAAMLNVVAHPSRLAELGQAARSVQARQEQDCERQWERILSGALVKSRWLYLLVNVDAFKSLRLYRHLVEMTFATFAKSYMVCTVGDRQDESDGAWRAFRRMANRYAHDIGPCDLEAGAVLILFDDPEDWRALVRESDNVVLFDDAAGMARRFRGRAPPASPVPKSWVRVRGDAGVRAPGHGGVDLPINVFRWLPWDMSVPATGDQYDRLDEVWALLGEDTAAKWGGLAERAFAGRPVRVFGGESEATEGNAVSRLMQTVFAEKQTPRLVLSLTLDEGFGLMKAWFTANSIALREFGTYAEGGACGPAESLGLPRLSQFGRPPDGRAALEENVTAAWEGSGWEELARIMSRWTAGRTVSGATL